MAKVSEITKPYFSHDESASQDRKILKVLCDFRKLAREMTREELESFVCHGAYGLFWRIVEFMHCNTLPVNDIDALADDLRIDLRFIERILKNYDLFRVEDDCYVSDRILRNLNKQQEKSDRGKKSAEIRWLLSAFNKSYIEFFGEEAILSSGEIENLKKYNEKIPDLRLKLRDIIYTLKTLKFDTDLNFVPCANWLLKDNNLARLVNGEFGPLKHKKTEKELREQQRRIAASEAERNKPSEFEQQIEKITNKTDALNFIGEFYKDKDIIIQRGRALILPPLRVLTEKFGISEREIIETCQNKEQTK